uniref:Uncharacterized protein n=1 Tax=Candidatus Methanogaster sp. ANME-2c ERB4 TaxID=2759911 RepID=A0A7G9YFQ2_9EURY|nr:hypothetical protein PLCHCCMC_00003 [Methanosarcinales archaeon ANME-2c ERB4]QNO46836.1 hypothetical protein FKCHNOGI_00001 [Methanosarcinales archaeon ANME-2c ERB4]
MVFALFPQMWKVLFVDVMCNLSLISSVIKIAECPGRWRRLMNPDHESRVFCCNWCLSHRCGYHRCQQATVPEKPAGSSRDAMKRPGLDGRAKTAQNFPAPSACQFILNGAVCTIGSVILYIDPLGFSSACVDLDSSSDIVL